MGEGSAGARVGVVCLVVTGLFTGADIGGTVAAGMGAGAATGDAVAGAFVTGRAEMGLAKGAEAGTTRAFSQPQATRKSSLSKRWQRSAGIPRSVSPANRICSHVTLSAKSTYSATGMTTLGNVIVETPSSKHM